RVEYILPDNDEPLVAVETDKEATDNTVMMFYKNPQKKEKTLADYREVIMQDIYNSMLNARLNEILQQPDAPFVYASTSYGSFIARTQDAYTSYAMMKENQIEKGIETLLIENERVKKFGFTETEFERQKQELLARYEKQAKEFNKTESANYTNDYVNNFLSQTAIPGAVNQFDLLKKLLPGIQLSEINSLPRQWITDKNLAIVVTAPEKEGVKVPTHETILSIIKNTKNNKEITPYIDKFKEAPLVNDNLQTSPVSKKTENSENGITEISLSNGIKIILKPTDFKNDEILMKAFSPGGNSLYPDKDIMSANSATTIIEQSGAGKFDNVELKKKLKGKVVEITPYIDDIKEGFNGSASPKDFETLLQLTYLYFNAPREDTSAMKTYISKTKNQLKFIKSNPMYAFYDTLIRTTTQNNPRVIVIPTEEQLSQITMNKVSHIYHDRFADASDFTFIFVGSFKSDTLIPLLEKYLGSLPVINRTETWKNVSPIFPAGVTDVSIRKGTEPKSMVGIVFSEKFDWNQKNRMNLVIINEILQIKLIEVIREELSGVYSPQTMLTFDKYPESQFSQMTMFGCSPKNTKKLSKAVLKIFARMQKKGPSETDLNKSKEKLIRARETDVKTNSFWLNRIETSYFNGDELQPIEKYNEMVNSITVGDIQKATQQFFKKNHYVRAVLLPLEK
ncbi:MAG: insulinase family protein, partial [Lentimicrobiaceae bacterium]|nr:insulinase family protein [Lentimicrobiaceae bacterium]